MADIDNVTVGENNYNLRDSAAQNALPTQGQVDDIIEALDIIAAKSNQPYNPSNLLNSDYVTDTNQTHKFATQAQLNQIETNKNNISLHSRYTLVDSSQGSHNYGLFALSTLDNGYYILTVKNTLTDSERYGLSLYALQKTTNDIWLLTPITEVNNSKITSCTYNSSTGNVTVNFDTLGYHNVIAQRIG